MHARFDKMWILAFFVSGVLSLPACSGPDLSQYESLRQPQLREAPNQKVVVVELGGDPSTVGGDAFGKVIKAYYKLKGKQEGMEGAAPRARWPFGTDVSPENWVGFYAMPVPDSVEALPEGTDPAVKLETWEYGKVAEILHVGPYSAETPTIEKLKHFIEEQGLEIAGLHEEEYLKGPGMFFKGNPEKYYTIIRYQVREKAAPEPAETPAPEGTGDSPSGDTNNPDDAPPPL